ncbi:RNA-directed DNA polymerase, eukaryota, reverse transcriptase zinc-binding domain protein [Tanacetum coccineum]
MKSIRSHFFNGADPNTRKMTLIKWDNVLVSKNKGGLGVSTLYALNRALIFKWVWRFRSYNFCLWSRVIKAIHGEDGKLDKFSYSGISSNWVDIVRDISLLKNKGIDLLGLVKKKVGNGENTKFWEETWKGDAPFKSVYPRIYALKLSKNISVASKMAHSSISFSLRRFPRGGIEQEQFAALLSRVEGLILPPIFDRWYSGRCQVIASKTRWNKAVPIKINILAWRVKLDNLPTRINLSLRGMELDSIFCPNCYSAVESTYHIFFNCPMVNDLYKRIATWWDITLVSMSNYEDWWTWFSNLRLDAKVALVG